jgi:hypothetical protein
MPRDFRFWLENNGVPSQEARDMRSAADTHAEKLGPEVNFQDEFDKELRRLFEEWKAKNGK